MQVQAFALALVFTGSMAAQTAPPPITATFDSASSNRVYPADASGAVGPSHVVTAVNSGLLVHDRTGRNIGQLTLPQFWEAPGEFIYHPRVAYDAAADRWVLASVRDGDAVLLAASQSGDPLGAWHRQRIDIPTGGELDLLKMALTRDSILLVAERLAYASCVMMRVQKSELYAGTANVEIDDAHASSSQVIPVSTTETADDYLLHSLSVGYIGIKRFDQEQWEDAKSPAGWRPGWFFANQRGTSNDLDFGFDGIQSAVLHDGAIWMAHMIATEQTRTRTVILWTKLDPVRRTVLAQGVIDDGHTYYGFPSIAAASRGVMVAYSTVSASEYPSARYVFIDPAGKVSAEATVRDGESSIRNFDLWGNYTSTVIDPAATSTFWTLQMFAKDNTWATAWASVQAPAATSRRRAIRH